MEELLPSLLQGVTLALITALGGVLAKAFKGLQADFQTLKDSQRQQIKAQIVITYERAVQAGSITPMELDTTCRMFEAYKDLGGNTYVEALVERLKSEMPIMGERIPEHE